MAELGTARSAADRPANGRLTAPTPPGSRRPPGPPRERRPALAALALVLMVGGALGAAYLVVQSGQRVGAIEIIRPVGAGERIPVSGMREVQVAVDGDLRYVPWSEAEQVGRYYAATAIPPGTLLSSAMVARTANLAAGKAVLGLELTGGQLPAGLRAGDRIDIYQVSDATQSCPGLPGTVLASGAVVMSISTPSPTSGSPATDVAVALDPVDAGQVACNAANGSVGVAEMPAGAARGRAGPSAASSVPPEPRHTPSRPTKAGHSSASPAPTAG